MFHTHSNEKYNTSRRLSSHQVAGKRSCLVEKWQHNAGQLTGVKPTATEIAIVLEGKLRVRRRGDDKVQETMAVPGTIWLCPAGIREDEIHLFGDIEECLHLFLPPQPISETALREFDLDPNRIKLNYEGGFHDPLIEQMGRVIAQELEQESEGSLLLIDSLQAALAAHLVKNYSNIPQSKIKLPNVVGGLEKKRLNHVDEYISYNIDKNISLDDLANEACLSPYHFARSFKASTGMAPHQYVLYRKLELAKTLIADGNTSLLQVALLTGFSSQAHFTRTFKRLVGLTPGEYRSTLQR